MGRRFHAGAIKLWRRSGYESAHWFVMSITRILQEVCLSMAGEGRYGIGYLVPDSTL